MLPLEVNSTVVRARVPAEVRKEVRVGLPEVMMGSVKLREERVSCLLAGLV